MWVGQIGKLPHFLEPIKPLQACERSSIERVQEFGRVLNALVMVEDCNEEVDRDNLSSSLLDCQIVLSHRLLATHFLLELLKRRFWRRPSIVTAFACCLQCLDSGLAHAP